MIAIECVLLPAPEFCAAGDNWLRHNAIEDDLMTRLSPDDERLMLHNLLDALDHLYDEHEFAPRWTWMLLVATKQAMRGTPWFAMLAVAGSYSAELGTVFVPSS